MGLGGGGEGAGGKQGGVGGVAAGAPGAARLPGRRRAAAARRRGLHALRHDELDLYVVRPRRPRRHRRAGRADHSAVPERLSSGGIGIMTATLPEKTATRKLVDYWTDAGAAVTHLNH